MRTRILLYGGLFIAAVLLSAGIYYGYQFYYANFAPTPEKAITEYFTAFGKGDYGHMYDMNRGVPGSPQTAADFAAQVRYLVKDAPPNIATTTLESIGSKGTGRYFKVLLKLVTPDGSYRMVSILVETMQDGDVWKVSYPFAPPF
jgi:hypothetical protein